MGNNTSREAPTINEKSTSQSSQSSQAYEELSAAMSKYLTVSEKQRLQFAGKSASEKANPISEDAVSDWEEKLLADPKNRLAMAAITNNEITTVIGKRTALTKDAVHVFNTIVKNEGAPITNQRQSGRCWLFASTNCFRIAIQNKFDVPEFQFSQAYLFFHDKLEKCNHFLNNIIETCDLPLDSRFIQTILADPASDGGQWDMVVNLVEKYGLVPQSVYPDSYHAMNSGRIDYVVVNKLREFALTLRSMKLQDGCPDDELLAAKAQMVQELYGVLAIAFGVPPRVTDKFTWDFVDSKGKAQSITATPLEFYSKVAGLDAGKYFSLIHDPRHAYNSLYTVDRLNNIVGGRPIRYVNADISVLKQTVLKMIQNNEPVFFGSDVGQFENTAAGIMDTEAWDYELAFNTSLGMTKKQRIESGASAMTHAMVITAVHVVDGQPVKYKVMNSWGTDVGDKGYFVMTDEWFSEYVFEVVTNAAYVDKSVSDVLKSKEITVLPIWDPMGSLA